MSTLKKILSLTLALAMLMSVSVFADFSDKEEIDEACAEDVNLLVSVNLLNGFEDGSFQPNGSITRAQAAKMIYVLCNKGVDDKAVMWAKGPFTFSDVTAADWFAGYVEYCATFGYIDGMGDGKFDPNSNVTGVQLAKMLLTVAGYKSEIQGYTGANWAKNVIADATTVGIFENCNFALNSAAPRQWAAKMFVNAFDVEVPVYIGDYLVSGVVGGGNDTVAEKFLELDSYIDVVIANDNWALTGSKAASKKTVLANAGEIDFDVADAMVGQQVTVSYNTKTDKIYGVAVTGKSISGVVTTALSSSKYTVKVGGTTFLDKKASQDLTGVVEIVAAGVKATATAEPATVAALHTLITGKTTAYSVYGYDVDGDKKLDYTKISEVEYGVVSDYDKTNKNFEVGSFIASKDDVKDGKVVVEGTIANGTVVKVAKNYITGKVTVTPADAAYGSFTGIAGTKYTIGGAQYEVAKDAIGTSFLVAGNLGKIATIYTDGKYIIKADEYTTSAPSTDDTAAQLTNKLAMLIEGTKITTQVTETDEWGVPNTSDKDIYKVKVLLSSGATAIFEYDAETKDTGAIKVADLFEGKALKADYAGDVYEYAFGTNGKIVLKKALAKTEKVEYYVGTFDNALATTDANGAGFAVKYDADKKLFVEGTTTLPVLASDSTLVFATYTNNKGEKEYKMVKVSELPKTATYTLIATTTDSIATAMILKAEYSFQAAAVVTETPYIIATSGVELRYDAEAKKVFAYFDAVDLNNAGAAVEYKAADTITVTSGKIYELTVEDGIVKAVAEDTWTKKIVTAKNGDMFMIDGDLVLAEDFAKNVKVIVKSGSTYTKGTIDSITVAKKTTEANMMVKEESGKIAYVIVTADGAKIG